MEIHFHVKPNRQHLRSLINLSKKNKTTRAIKFECFDNTIKATATNNDFMLSCLLEGSIYEDGEVFLPTESLDKVMKSSTIILRDTSITHGEEPEGLFSQGDTETLNFTETPFILDDDTFETFSGKKITQAQAIELGYALKNAVRFLSKEEGKNKTTGVYYDHLNRNVVSTDGTKLFTQKISFDFLNAKALIPADAIPILVDNLINANANVKDNHLNIQNATTRYSILLINDVFPNYQVIMPKDTDLEKINISARGKQALYESEKVIDTPIMKIDVDERSTLRLTNTESQYVWQENEFQGKERSVTFNINNLTQVLALTENIYCNPKNFSSAPFLFTKDSVKILLMPTKV
jgi:DNA polymerase III sliding clamp (beta) subunit (PCNA family)